MSLAICVATIVAITSGGNDDARYDVDAIFDTAKGIVPGQVVKIAGARVGDVVAVDLVPGPAARIELAIDRRFAPFRADARCRILPEGLISENYVECDPGRARGGLEHAASGRPTIARNRTTVPVSVQDMVDIFAAPTNERLRIVIASLGAATAGRGTDLNAVLRRTNPALTQAQALLGILRAQNQTIASAVGQTDQILTSVTRDRSAVRQFVGQAANAAEAAAPARAALGRTLRRLPQTLAVADATLRRVGQITRSARPLLDEVRGAAPALDSVTKELPRFSREGSATLRSLSPVLGTANKVAPRAVPLIRALRRFARAARPVVPQLRDLLVSVRDTGGVEGVLNLGYMLASMSSGYDAVSHMAGVYIGVAPECIVSYVLDRLVKTTLPGGCDHGYRAAGRGTVPVNAPSAGPQLQWDTALSGARASIRPPVRRTRLSAKASTQLLDFLLR